MDPARRRSARLKAVHPAYKTAATARHRKHRVSPQPAPDCIGGDEQPLGLENIGGDIILRIASFLTTPQTSLAALAAASKYLHTTLHSLVEAERRALAASVCTKLSTTEAALAATTELYCQGRGLTDAEGVWLVHHLSTSGCLERLTTIWLFSNKLGDRTCRALASACRQRTAAPCLRTLWLNNNAVGSGGMCALADVLAAPACGGALVELCVGENAIDDVGLNALQGLLRLDSFGEPAALPQLRVLVLERNRASSVAQHQLRRAVKARKPHTCPRPRSLTHALTLSLTLTRNETCTATAATSPSSSEEEQRPRIRPPPPPPPTPAHSLSTHPPTTRCRAPPMWVRGQWMAPSHAPPPPPYLASPSLAAWTIRIISR
jgi:hypothetical protein